MKTAKIAFICSVFLIVSGCTSSSLAPVVNGWDQPRAKKQNYVVQKGDTIYSIAWAFGVDYRDLADINGLQSPYSIQIGQTLTMGAPIKAKVKKSAMIPEVVDVNEPQPDVKPRATIQAKPQSQAESSSVATSNAVPRFIRPVTGKIVARYGLKGNKGMDFAGFVGESIIASSAGEVVYAGDGIKGYGMLIIVKSSDDFLVAYAYNQKLLVSEGDHVKRGQRIATMGLDRNNHPRLHFEIRKQGQPVNPKPYIS